MIFISPVKTAIDDCEKSTSLNKHTIGATTVYYSNEYSVNCSSNEILIYYGIAACQNELIDLQLIQQQGAHNLFPKAIGPFFFIKITPSETQIYNSLLRTVDLFYRRSEDGFELSTELSLLLGRISNSQIQVNIDYCLDFLLGKSCYGGETPFHDIHQVIMGGQYTFKEGTVQRDFMPPSGALHANSESITNMLGTNLETLSKKFKKITLSFSGGLDSSYLLAVMSYKKIDFVAEHYLPIEGELSSEVTIAEEYCKIFNKSLEKIEVGGAIKLAPGTTILANSPHDVTFFEQESSQVDYSEFCSVNGHGGDNVFLQNPPYMVGADVLRKSGLRAALQKIMQLAALKKLNLYKLLFLNILVFSRIWKYLPYPEYPDWLSRFKSASKENHPLLDAHYRGSAKFAHIERILSSLYTTKQGTFEASTSFSPLLFQNIVAFVIEYNCEDTYDSQLDRLLPRTELSKLVDAPIIKRTQKKPSTDFMFSLMNCNAEEFRNFLIKGRMIKLLNIDANKLNQSINSNTETGLTNDLPFLIRLYRLESYFAACPNIYFAKNSK